MAITSLTRWATEAAASLPSTVIWRRAVMANHLREIGSRSEPDQAPGNGCTTCASAHSLTCGARPQSYSQKMLSGPGSRRSACAGHIPSAAVWCYSRRRPEGLRVTAPVHVLLVVADESRRRACHDHLELEHPRVEAKEVADWTTFRRTLDDGDFDLAIVDDDRTAWVAEVP